MDEKNQELEELKIKCEEYLNGWKRAKADFSNYQKDEVKRFEEFLKFANANIIKDFLVVLDSLHLALVAHPEDKGLLVVKNQCEDILRRHGLEAIAVAPGDECNPARHESIAAVDAEGIPSGNIAEEVERGYTLHGKVIRPTRVKIAK